MRISSAKNPTLQAIRRAAQSGRALPDGSIVLEGPVLLEEVYRSQWEIVQKFATDAARQRWPALLHDATELSDKALEGTAATEHSQGVITLVRPVTANIERLLTADAMLLVLDGIQDPGNAGTLVRSAEAFGATAVFACNGSVRLANGKFLRASAGSLFRVPFAEVIDAAELIRRLRRFGSTVYALEAGAETSIADADLTGSCAIVVGNEGQGLSLDIKKVATAVSIPMTRVESLNAAVAGSIALFTASEERRRR